MGRVALASLGARRLKNIRFNAQPEHFVSGVRSRNFAMNRWYEFGE